MVMVCFRHSWEKLLGYAKLSKGVVIEDSLELVICLVKDRMASGNARATDQDRQIAICFANFFRETW